MNSDWDESAAFPLRLPDLAGKTAIVTGTSQGLGQAVARLLLDNDTAVFGLAHELTKIDHPKFTPLVADLADVSAIQGAIQSVAKVAPKLDYVVNVAGIDPKHSIDTVSASDWDRVVDVNLRAYYFLIKEALPLLRKGEGKSIVNVSSINYRLGVPGRAPYSATKAGILGLTTGLSRELGQEGIRVNSVSPGWIFTDRQIEEYFTGESAEKNFAYLEKVQSVKLKIRPEDIANHILFYLSAAGRASIGHNCVVDGGWLLE